MRADPFRAIRHARRIRDRQPAASPMTYAVLLCMAAHGDADGYDIRPSNERVADEIGCSVSTVERSIRDLVTWRELIRLNGPAHRGSAACYRLNLGQKARHTDVLSAGRKPVTDAAKARHTDGPPLGDLGGAARSARSAPLDLSEKWAGEKVSEHDECPSPSVQLLHHHHRRKPTVLREPTPPRDVPEPGPKLRRVGRLESIGEGWYEAPLDCGHSVQLESSDVDRHREEGFVPPYVCEACSESERARADQSRARMLEAYERERAVYEESLRELDAWQAELDRLIAEQP